MMARNVRIGCGSAYADDDLALAIDMVRRGQVDYLSLDCLAERTLALAQLRRVEASAPGYDSRLPAMVTDLFPAAREAGVKVVGNMGAADPVAAGAYVRDSGGAAGLSGWKVGTIVGDEVRNQVLELNPPIIDTDLRVADLQGSIVSANAYIGVEPILAALEQGADLVIGGRLADPSVFAAPLIHEFGWRLDDWEHLGRATCVGHLLECGVCVTGGNFADPPYAVVESFDNPSFPLAEVDAHGSAVIEKLPNTGGLLSAATCKIQLGYEIQDPARYITPDVTADFSRVEVKEMAGRVQVTGASGTARPEQLKVLIGVDSGYFGEGQVSYAGPGALDRAMLARNIVRERLDRDGLTPMLIETRLDLMGVDAIHGPASPAWSGGPEPYEVHLRLAVLAKNRVAAHRASLVAEYLQLFGPAGTSGHKRDVRRAIVMHSCFIPRDAAPWKVSVQAVE
jgi:hypothetical protein